MIDLGEFEQYVVKQDDTLSDDDRKNIQEMNAFLQSNRPPLTGRVMASIEGFNRPFARLAEGGLNPLLGGLKGFEREKLASKNRYEIAKQDRPIFTGAGEIAGEIGLGLASGIGGEMAVAKAAPKIWPWVSRSLGGGLGLGAVGGIQSDEDRLSNAMMNFGIGTSFGAAGEGIAKYAPPVAKYLLWDKPKQAYQYAKKFIGNKDSVLKDLVDATSKTQMQNTEKVLKAADELGVQLTPGEATGNPIIAAIEGNLGKTRDTLKKILSFKEKSKKAQKDSIDNLLNDISPDTGSNSERIRQISQDIINERKAKIVEEATPFYEAAKKERIGDSGRIGVVTPRNSAMEELLSNSIVNKEYKNVLENPKYASEIKSYGYGPNSLGVMDIVKQNIDALIETAKKNKNQGDYYRYQAAKNHILNHPEIKKSANYKKGRGVYVEEMPDYNQKVEGVLGKIAKTKDTSLKNISTMILDSTETNPKVLSKIRDEIYKVDPSAWNTMVRNHMERKLLRDKHLSQTGNYGSTFFNKILSVDGKMYKAALKNNPEQVKALENMELVFKNLFNPETAKTARGKAATSMDKSRSSVQEKLNILSNIVGSNYDNSAVAIITDPKWAKSFNQEFRRMEALKRLAGKKKGFGEPEAKRMLKFIRDAGEAAKKGAELGTTKKGAPVLGALSHGRNVLMQEFNKPEIGEE